MNAWKQLRAILLLPGLVAVIIPAAILYGTGIDWLPSPWDIILPVVGSVLIFLGLVLIAWTNRLFITVGKGLALQEERAPLDAPVEAVEWIIRG